MNYSLSFLLFWFFLGVTFLSDAQSQCVNTISGVVLDEYGEIVIGATISSDGVKAVSNQNGNFNLQLKCGFPKTITVCSIGYITQELVIWDSLKIKAVLKLDQKALSEVVVRALHNNESILASQPLLEVDRATILKSRGLTLAELFKNLTGVNSIQTGPSIFKPIIHGMHSNRVLVLNNGVRQEDQQWGAEHGPSIDPFANQIFSVIKGASSIRYGSDAIGGVISVQAATMKSKKGIYGEMNLIGSSNNGMGAVSGLMGGAFGNKLKGLSWRTQASWRRAGSVKTPNYYMENTGFKELNFSTMLSYTKKQFGADLYFSQFNTHIGIFTGGEAENIEELKKIIALSQPSSPSYFSYKINEPYQHVKHDLFKVNLHWYFNDKSHLDVLFARQQNERWEYEDSMPDTPNQPALYLRLITNSAEIAYKTEEKSGFSSTLGVSGLGQNNKHQYEFLIPDFQLFSTGAFGIVHKRVGRYLFEGGLRYDLRWLNTYKQDGVVGQEENRTFNYKNLTGTIGSRIEINQNFSITANFSTAWRAPAINELLSNGTHQSAFSYEIGNSQLQLERAYNLGATLKYYKNRLSGELDLYNNIIADYIYLKPDLSFITNERGTFPVYRYSQANARFSGIDLSLGYRLLDSLSLSSKISLLYARNTTDNQYIPMLPSNRFENSIRYGFSLSKGIKQLFVELTSLAVSSQKRVPPNSDYLPPPSAYWIWSSTAGFSFLIGKQEASFSLSVNNIFNTVYREYLNRFRFYSDEVGRNFTIRFSMRFETK